MEQEYPPWMVFFPGGKKVAVDSEYLLVLSADLSSWTSFLRMLVTGEPARMTITYGKDQSATTSIIVVRKANATSKSTYENPYAGK